MSRILSTLFVPFGENSVHQHACPMFHACLRGIFLPFFQCFPGGFYQQAVCCFFVWCEFVCKALQFRLCLQKFSPEFCFFHYVFLFVEARLPILRALYLTISNCVLFVYLCAFWKLLSKSSFIPMCSFVHSLIHIFALSREDILHSIWKILK